MSVKRKSRFEHEMIEEFEDGEAIFQEGDTGRDLYIIQRGDVRIVKTIGDREIEVAEFNRGDFFGDIALLQSIPRFVSAYAKGTTRLLIVKPAGFLLKIRRDPTFAFELLQQMSLRVKVSNDRVFAIAQKFNLPSQEVQKILLELNGKE